MRHGAIILCLLLFTGSLNTASGQQQLFTTYTMNEGLVHNSIQDIYQDSKGFIWIATWEGISKYDGNKFTNYTTVNGLSHGLINEFYESKDGMYIFCNNGTVNILHDGLPPQKTRIENLVVNKIYELSSKKILATDKNGIWEFNEGKPVKPRQAYPQSNYYAFARLNDSLFIAESDYSVDILNHRYELYSRQTADWPLFAECATMTDSKNRVWLGTRKGLRLVSPLQFRGTPVRFLDLPTAFNIPLLKTQSITDLLEDDAGNIWIGTLAGLAKVNADGTHQIITKKDGLPTNDVTALFQDRESNLWVGGTGGVARLVTRTSIKIYTTENGLASNNVSLLLPFSNGNMLVQNPKGLQVFTRGPSGLEPAETNRSYYADNDRNGPLSAVVDKTTGNTYLVFDCSQTQHVPFAASSAGPYFAFKDKYGGYFIPSLNGIYYCKKLGNCNKVLFHASTHHLLIDSKGDLWAGSTDDGIYRISYDYANDTPRLKSMDHFLNGIGIRSLYEDSKGFIWAGSRYHGVYRFAPAAASIYPILHLDQSKGLTSNRVTSIAEDEAGCIWLDFYNGLDKLIPLKDSFRVFNFSRVNNFFTNIQQMAFGADHSLWLASTDGLVNISDGKMETAGPLNVFITSASLGDSVYRYHPHQRISLSYRHKQVQFEFAAPGYINEKQVLFSYRLVGGSNTEWSQASNEHRVSYANLQPGTYRFEVRNKGWNDQWGKSASFDFVIRPPFWQTWWFITAIGLVTAGAVYWLVKRRIRTIRTEGELKQKIAETEMMALRAQMNPHFIFNCLNAIDNLVQTNQKEKATTYLARFAKLIRSVLDSSKNNLVPFQNDYESLQLYLQMEQFRCNNKFSYELNADEELLHSDYKLPPLIVQPFVENAIHHGLLNKQTGDRKLFVSAALETDHIKYTVTDNGVGRIRASEIKELNKPGHRSYGLAITTERIHLHNQNSREKDIVITDLSENGTPAGTRVEIKLKIADNK